MSTFNPDWILDSPTAESRRSVNAFCPECGCCLGIAQPRKRTTPGFIEKWRLLGLVVHELHGRQRPRAHWHADGCAWAAARGVKA